MQSNNITVIDPSSIRKVFLFLYTEKVNFAPYNSSELLTSYPNSGPTTYFQLVVYPFSLLSWRTFAVQ